MREKKSILNFCYNTANYLKFIHYCECLQNRHWGFRTHSQNNVRFVLVRFVLQKLSIFEHKSFAMFPQICYEQ